MMDELDNLLTDAGIRAAAKEQLDNCKGFVLITIGNVDNLYNSVMLERQLDKMAMATALEIKTNEIFSLVCGDGGTDEQ